MFLSIIDCFNVFSYKRIITFIQPLSLIFCIFNFEKKPFLIRIAVVVIKTVLLCMIQLSLRLKSESMLEVMVAADPNEISVINTETFL